jgi:hypothetical protein
VRTDHGHFDVFDFIGRDVFSEEFEGADVAWSNSLDFTSTKPSLCTLETLCLESSNIGDV